MNLPVPIASEQLDLVTGDVLAEYLVRSGWIETSRDDRTLTWTIAIDGRSLRAVIPLVRDADDYRSLLVEALNVIAFAGRRSMSELLADLEYGGADIVSIRLVSDAPSGQAPLSVAQVAITALRNFVVGAAAGLSARGAVLRGPRPRAERYASRVRVATGAGSFVVTLALPLSEDVVAQTANADDEPAQLGLESVAETFVQPFGHQVATRMRRVATTALALSEQVGEGTEDISVFENDPGQSGNAMELEAMATLGGKTPIPYKLRFVDSAIVRETSASSAVLTVSPEAQDRFTKAARLLRERKRKADVTISGKVVRLARDGGLGEGEVVIRGSDPEGANEHRYRVRLSDDDYHQALLAHDQGSTVAARGTLEIKGNFLWLEDLKFFAVQQALLDGGSSPEPGSTRR